MYGYKQINGFSIVFAHKLCIQNNITMNLANYTIKAQQTIAAAQQLAFNNNNPSIETEHLLQAILEDRIVRFRFC